MNIIEYSGTTTGSLYTTRYELDSSGHTLLNYHLESKVTFNKIGTIRHGGNTIFGHKSQLGSPISGETEISRQKRLKKPESLEKQFSNICVGSLTFGQC